jgi:hypothetical protein
MQKIVIILGAGASHDYFSFEHGNFHDAGKPPLANELVYPEKLNAKIAGRYPDVNDLLADVVTPVMNKEKSLEEALKNIKDNFGAHDHRKKQLIAFQFYLRDLFAEISSKCHPFNNYKILYNKIRDHNNGQACIATFNYDTLLERSIGNIGYGEHSSYIKNPIKIIKLHGSHDWAYIGDKKRKKLLFQDITDSYQYLTTYPEHMDKLHARQDVYPYHISELGKEDDLFQFPAIAIPLPEKQDFICPERHVEILKAELINVDKILIIGWRAGDPYLIELMENTVSKDIPVHIVSNVMSSAEEVQRRLSHIKRFMFELHNGGFSKFIHSDASDLFFTQKVRVVNVV